MIHQKEVEAAETASNHENQLPKGNKENIKVSEAEERRLFKKVFQPKIKRKPYKKRSIRKTCEELVKSFYPETEVTYEAMKMKLISQFDRCSRPTVLSYLGRIETRQIETVYHDIETAGNKRTKNHTFTHRLPAKKGFVEIFGYATLLTDQINGKTWYKLHHTEQTKIDSPIPPRSPPHESFAQEESGSEVIEEFKAALEYAKRPESQKSSIKNFSLLNSGVKDVEENTGLQCNPEGETDGDRERAYKKRKKFEVSESNLSDEESRLFRVYDSSVREAS